jgi:CheY-like chemotaxis protein
MILFVDDETRHISNFVSELEVCGYQISVQSDVDLALQFLEDSQNDVELMILDIMMPPGKRFKHLDTDAGLRTGVHFYERAREIRPELPVIILTNVSDVELEVQFQREANCRYLQKKHYLPYEVAHEVNRILSPIEIMVEGEAL